MKRCNNCNKLLTEDAKFCTYCGTAVEETVEQIVEAEFKDMDEEKENTFKLLFSRATMFIVFMLLITLILTAISSIITGSNLSVLYRGFKYPSILLSIGSIVYALYFIGKDNEESNFAKLDTVIISWFSKKGKKSGNLDDMINSKIDGQSIALGLYECSKNFENKEIPNYLKLLIEFIKKEEITDNESLHKCFERRLQMRKSKFNDSFDNEVKRFRNGMYNTIVNGGIIRKGIKKSRNIVRIVGVFLILFSIASIIRMEVELEVVMFYTIEGAILLFISKYIFGLEQLGKEFKFKVKSLNHNIKNVKSFILEIGDFNEALALSIALNKYKKFTKAVKKLSYDDISELRISDAEINESYKNMNYYLNFGELIYKNSIYGRNERKVSAGGEPDGE